MKSDPYHIFLGLFELASNFGNGSVGNSKPFFPLLDPAVRRFKFLASNLHIISNFTSNLTNVKMPIWFSFV